jgi:RNA polymerase sigma factor for flagellar operon FliA
MPDRPHFESLFLEHLPWIERVARIACSKHGMWEATEDFTSWITLKLMEDDYVALRRFRGEADLKTYLAVVVRRQFQEYRREQGGRWRPSAAAERLGQPAKDLEALVYRDGYSLAEAGEKLRTAGRTGLSDTELGRLLAQLPRHRRQRPMEVSADSVLDGLQGTSYADKELATAEAEALRDRVMDALHRVRSRLDPENQEIVRMHFAEGRSLADVARALGLEQKPLYRRVDKLRRWLRAELLAEGVHDTDVLGISPEEEGS